MAITNILIKTFDGLDLPSTISLRLPSSAPISVIFENLDERLPCDSSALLLSTTSGKVLSSRSSEPISSFGDDFLTLRLHLPLCGGKGGFGSQLRAAGGRMSSRKRKGQENNDSCRNLDGRRMRTVKEAKALAAYLEIKPDMDEKEREKRRERWEKVVENADEKIKGGGVAKNERFTDTKWLEENDETKDRTRDAVLKALKNNGGIVPRRPILESGSSSSASLPSDEEEDEQTGSSSDDDVRPVASSSRSRPTFLGFDEDDEFMSSSDEEDEEKKPEGMADIQEVDEQEEDEGPKATKGKRKART